MGSTLVGPHRDDLEFSLNGSAARDYGSQGQQRTVALALKLAEHEFLTAKLGRKPICLMDDVLSELDPARRENLVAWLMDGSQCLVSLTSLKDFPEAISAASSADCQVIQVVNGEVIQEERVNV
jgi:DNA replication and repair protein RecF